MKCTIIAVGRLRASPEKTLVDDYLDRFTKTGRALGLGPAHIMEIDERKVNGMANEAKAITKYMPAGAKLITLDERGDTFTSSRFADHLRNWADQGVSDCAFVIGGADGIDPGVRQDSALSLSFGKMVWPHMLARVMLAEQLYRAATILAGSPYHRT